MTNPQPRQQTFNLGRGAVVMIADHRCPNIKMRQQLGGVARVFRRDDIYFTQGLDTPQCHVAQVANWGRNDI